MSHYLNRSFLSVLGIMNTIFYTSQQISVRETGEATFTNIMAGVDEEEEEEEEEEDEDEEEEEEEEEEEKEK
ncbi:hypothetical protein ElyMa_002785900 [Elysia marginata]|uniref:Uncharacterized protein n=1 Tax=Elysia marginata TaxID=1093978 RepID=A0AAV4HPZ8_9GAST|nr:hypothetical protein ElyMa_002785900 [Elysia marginata]